MPYYACPTGNMRCSVFLNFFWSSKDDYMRCYIYVWWMSYLNNSWTQHLCNGNADHDTKERGWRLFPVRGDEIEIEEDRRGSDRRGERVGEREAGIDHSYSLDMHVHWVHSILHLITLCFCSRTWQNDRSWESFRILLSKATLHLSFWFSHWVWVAARCPKVLDMSQCNPPCSLNTIDQSC